MTHPRDEFRLIEGRADTVYNRLVIEYEPPGSLRTDNKHGKNQHAIQQVKDYITGLHRRERHTMERYAGVVCDGAFLIFLRFVDEQWHIEPPVPVNIYSCERFLHYLAALQTELATTPENLLRDFGENTPSSRKCVAAFYGILTTTTDPKVSALFDQWSRQFSEICGYEPNSPRLDVEAVARLYAVRAGARDRLQPFKLFFAIHTYYATFIKLLAVQIVNFYARNKLARIAHHEPVTLQQAIGLDTSGLRQYLQTMEEGGIFRHLGIRNFLEGDFFGWYLSDWTEEVDQSLRAVMQRLANYSFVTLDTDPDGTRDLLKKLYQNLMPQELRHDLGEYPVFQPKFDYIAGNPPWINWANLPDEYRQRTVFLWTTYRLFEHKGLRARLGAAMDDLSVLMLYVAADRYLKSSGRIGFVITQTIFKTAGGGEGFRRLQLGNSEHLKVLHVDDFSRVQCFEGATNRTSLLFLKKGEPTQYPVPYTYWRKKSGRAIPPDSDFEEAMSLVERMDWIARPIDTKKKTSPWITGGAKTLGKISIIIAPSQYQGRHGSHTHLSGVYWLEVISTRKDGSLLVSNLHTAGKTHVRNVNMAIEPDFIFPLLRGRDVQKWFANPRCAIVLPQDPSDPAKAYPVKEMQKRYPRTFAYLYEFEDQLRQRSGFKQFFDTKTAPFYSVYNVGPYTYSRFKVVWREQASVLTAAVAISTAQGNPIVPDHKLMLCSVNSAEEAHYVCALLNSLIAQFIVKSYGLETSISSHIFNHLSIRKFDPRDDLHRELAVNSSQLHAATSAGNQVKVLQLEETNMELAGRYWSLRESETNDIRRSLESLAQPRSQVDTEEVREL